MGSFRFKRSPIEAEAEPEEQACEHHPRYFGPIPESVAARLLGRIDGGRDLLVRAAREVVNIFPVLIPLVVTDTLEDARCADNPAGTSGARIRFYAGCPIRSPRGVPVLTLCVIHPQPRDIHPVQIGLLQDLAAIVDEEIAGNRARP